MLSNLMKQVIVVGATLCATVGCKESVSPEPIGDYTTWKRIDVTGVAPGHSDTYRIIYINDIAADPTADFRLGYPVGSVIVKEIRANNNGEPGDINYIAMMRKIEATSTALTDEGGWLFTQSKEPGGSETYTGLCWNRCHVAAPYNGAWYDYRK
jgi:Cytochrome P460